MTEIKFGRLSDIKTSKEDFIFQNKDVMISKHFKLIRFIRSQWAERCGLDNTPETEHVENAKALFENVIEKVWDQYNAVWINSGYRSPKLNAYMNGSRNSQHCLGEAVDIEIPGVAALDGAKWIRDNLEFDQLILENAKPYDPSAGWIHVSYKRDGKNRKECWTSVFTHGSQTHYPELGFEK